jgi:CheY-like chemotaxis protein
VTAKVIGRSQIYAAVLEWLERNPQRVAQLRAVHASSVVGPTTVVTVRLADEDPPLWVAVELTDLLFWFSVEMTKLLVPGEHRLDEEMVGRARRSVIDRLIDEGKCRVMTRQGGGSEIFDAPLPFEPAQNVFIEATIVVADGDPAARDFLRRVLEAQGHTVIECETGADAYEIIKRQRVSLLICEIVMPEMEGIELIVSIKDFREDQKILAISAGGRIKKEDYLAHAAAVGAEETMPKPLDAAALIAKVEAMLSGPLQSR